MMHLQNGKIIHMYRLNRIKRVRLQINRVVLSILVISLLLLSPYALIQSSAAISVSSQQVNFPREDGVQMTGLLNTPSSGTMKIGIILIHGGFQGSINEPFFNSIPSLLSSKGFAVLSLDMTRSHNFPTSVFEDSEKDIAAAVKFMKGQGYNSIFLAGHSDGAHEVIYYQAQTRDPSIVALGLYAAASVFKHSAPHALGMQQYYQITNQATDLVAKGSVDQIVYTGSIFLPGRPSTPSPTPFSARTWLSWIGPDSNLDSVKTMHSVSVPVLVLVHQNDNLLKWNQWYYGNATSSPKADLKTYTTATSGNVHDFQGFENQVVSDTVDWLTSIPTPRDQNQNQIITRQNNDTVLEQKNSTSMTTTQGSITIPSWVKSNAKWWADGSIGDNDFVKGIQYLIQQKIITIPPTTQGTSSQTTMPSWIKKDAGWWSAGEMSNEDFIKAIQYLVTSGIINP